VNPPLRQEADRQEILRALEDGTVDAIATDHAPHRGADKEGGAPGFTGLETAFAVCFSVLVGERRMGLKKLSALMGAQPARILGLLDRGRLEVGLRGDVTLIDPEKRWTVRPNLFLSRGKNSPFANRELRGRVLMTIHGGRIVYGGL
jgi:dihydroorotase